jgi:3-oxoacyl-[acyl-carrier protein] reductase
MDLGLRDRVALVTGASRGLGRAIAGTLAAEGCRLAIVARGADALALAAAEIAGDDPGRVLALPLDVTAPDAGHRLVEAALERFGAIDIVVNNVGGNRRKPFLETTDEDWRQLLELNLLAGLRLARETIPHLAARGDGAIVFVSSLYGRETGGPGLSLYNATKSAVISAAGILALELAPRGIRVNSVAPGSILFPGGSWDRRFRDDEDGRARFIAENLPLGRFGTAQEVADAVTWLASPRASLVTGACLALDGAQGRSLI